MLKGALETEQAGADAQVYKGEAHSRKEGFFELRYVPSARRTSSALWRFLVLGRSDIT